MAKAILNAGMDMGALAHRRADTFEGKIVDFQIEALTASGFSIVHKDEIHAPSVERSIDQELFRRLDFGSENKGAALEADECRSIAAALRELMKEVGR
jgi:hypothetical protein